MIKTKYKIVGVFEKAKPMSPKDKAYYDEILLIARQLMKKGRTRLCACIEYITCTTWCNHTKKEEK